MKKYSDWQRYVKEQMDKMGEPGGEAGKPVAAKPAPAIDQERFIIHRKDAAAQPAAGARGPAPLLRPPERQAASSTASPAAPLQGSLYPAGGVVAPPAEEPARPKASPFVSVSDVWKAIEKPPPPAQQEPAPNRMPAQPLKRPQPVAAAPGPAPAQAPGNASPATAAAARERVSREQTREEILERLFNPTISLEEAAKIMGVCKATVRRYTAMGILPHYRTPGNQRRFKLNDIILFLENQKK